MPSFRFSRGLAVMLTALLALPAFADPLPLRSPEGPVILTIRGEITAKNDGDLARFDLAMLEELGVQKLTTSTPWTLGKIEFEGVPLSALLDRVGATGDLIFAEAYNDYNSEIPTSDAREDHAMVVFRMNGREMTLRDKGPLWVIFPYDEDRIYRTEIYLTRSIWQLDRLTVRSTSHRRQN